MKTRIKILLIIGIPVVVFLCFYLTKEEMVEIRAEKNVVSNKGPSNKENLAKDHPIMAYQHVIWKYMNKDVQKVIDNYGEADRIDPTPYGYEWWIYKEKDQYFQIGVKENKIVSIYTPSEPISIQPFKIGQAYQEISDSYELKNEIEFDNLRFKLSDKDLKLRPVVKLSDNNYVQLYFDQYEQILAGVRYMNKELMEIQKPYELYYAGTITEPENPSKEEWKGIEQGMEKQILDVTNLIRAQYNVSELSWDDLAAKAAKDHSKDMFEQNYFSHYSLNGDGLKERLTNADAYYLSAGENIAANYVDVPAVIHGWLNSEGHRDALLKEEYTHLGAGAYHLYYTQNFLQK
ncbi:MULTISPECIES: CAP domain-containing protein [Gracilibacillus]|uniref:Uncharacterized protein n=1 Tax=Gracilibacillus dipsosauri TaxID=178340 RepID=A0A317L130_9BACI|nr:CAP domain-containing protein [Gracilibacillus dipsosauri]PWU68974.1 hypothetical protein DLJ74_11215 [Gracilibacillus dipsosauri]